MRAIWSLLQLLNSAIAVRKNHRQYINKRADCITRKLYLQKQEVGWIWPLGHHLLTFDINNTKIWYIINS